MRHSRLVSLAPGRRFGHDGRVTTVSTNDLQNALARHLAATRLDAAGSAGGPRHLCGPACSQVVGSLLAGRGTGEGADLTGAWLAHWREDPDWRWTSDNFWDSDHSCGPDCAGPIAERMTPVRT